MCYNVQLWFISVFAGRELSLPDISMIHGRLLVCAWEIGLVNVDDAVVKIVMQALEVYSVPLHFQPFLVISTEGFFLEICFSR